MSSTPYFMFASDADVAINLSMAQLQGVKYNVSFEYSDGSPMPTNWINYDYSQLVSIQNITVTFQLSNVLKSDDFYGK